MSLVAPTVAQHADAALTRAVEVTRGFGVEECAGRKLLAPRQDALDIEQEVAPKEEQRAVVQPVHHLPVILRLPAAERTPQQQVQLQLYSHTHRDGAGWHYEWIKC